MSSPDLAAFGKAVDAKADAFVSRLAAAVAIPSISAELSRRGEVFRMASWLQAELSRLGVVVESRTNPLGKQAGTDIDLPPILLGTYGTDPSKRTVLVYGHYDVQPASKSDGWRSEPFELTPDADTGRMYGRGSSDDKGPVLGWLNAIEAFKDAGVDFPVNLKCCFEGMEEYGSEGLDDLIRAEARAYFGDVDCVCISDNYWLGSKKPCLTYGLRGVSYFNVVVNGPGADLHSGVFGGTVHEPMTDLVQVLASLVDSAGRIQIDGIYDQVAALTDAERGLYDSIDFSLSELQDAVGAKTNIKPTIQETLMARWRHPSLSVHGVEGAFSGSGAKTVIPARVAGKFSIRTVPDMDPAKVSSLVRAHVERVFAELGTKNTLAIEELHAGKPWYSSPDHWNFRAASAATEFVYGVKPDLTREGGSIPVTLTFEEALGKNVCLLPMGQGNDGAHSVNEKLDRSNYIQGTKLLGAYLYEIARVDVSS